MSRELQDVAAAALWALALCEQGLSVMLRWGGGWRERGGEGVGWRGALGFGL